MGSFKAKHQSFYLSRYLTLILLKPILQNWSYVPLAFILRLTERLECKNHIELGFFLKIESNPNCNN